MREENVVNFYVLCNKLKDVVRTGWKNWGVKRKRIESVAEHIYGTQMLAIAMWSEYKYDIDLKKVLSMLAVHELEETKIGDLTIFDIDRKTKNEIGHKAIEEILCNLAQGSTIKQLIFEFDERKTKEAKFAFYCDKLEADLQCKLYCEENCVNAKKQVRYNSDERNNSGKLAKKNLWIFGRYEDEYDASFKNMSAYVRNSIIMKG